MWKGDIELSLHEFSRGRISNLKVSNKQNMQIKHSVFEILTNLELLSISIRNFLHFLLKFETLIGTLFSLKIFKTFYYYNFVA